MMTIFKRRVVSANNAIKKIKEFQPCGNDKKNVEQKCPHDLFWGTTPREMRDQLAAAERRDPRQSPVQQKKMIMRQCDALAPPGSAEKLKSIASKV
jgi:hypothetical protein